MMNLKMKISWAMPAIATVISGCGATQYEFDKSHHITAETVSQERDSADPSGVPDLVGSAAELPELVYEGSEEIFDVVVENIGVRELLLSLADQAQLNLDVDPSVDGIVSLNAYGQTLDQVMERVRKQLPIRYERIGNAVVVMNDELYYRQYAMNFPNLSRSYEASASGDTVSSGEGSLGSSTVESTKEGSGSVWTDLVEAIDQVLTAGFYEPNEGTDRGPVLDAIENEEEEREALNASGLAGRSQTKVVIEPFSHSLPDAGLLIVYASSEQHAIIGDIVEKVSSSSQRQVLLQATVVEILLNNTYQQGIDWSVFNGTKDSPTLIQSATLNSGSVIFAEKTIEAASDRIEELTELRTTLLEGGLGASSPQIARISSLINGEIAAAGLGRTPPPSQAGFLGSTFSVGDLDVAVSLLDRFGDAKVVSSPRISTLNGQGAILKVVEDQKYFTVETTTTREDGVITTQSEVEEETIPIGFVVNVFPQIGADGTIILAMRPSISRVVGYADSPAVGDLASSRVPVVSVKEIETLMLLRDGQTAVMGGLIEDQNLDNSSGVPGLNRVPGLGGLFENKNEQTRRVEYVIFVSAKIIKNPSLHGDYNEYLDWLPSDETLHRDQTTTFFGNEISKVSSGK